jgi:hypothetical protein
MWIYLRELVINFYELDEIHDIRRELKTILNISQNKGDDTVQSISRMLESSIQNEKPRSINISLFHTIIQNSAGIIPVDMLYSPIQDLFDYLFVQSILMKQNRNLVKLN